MTYIDPHRPPIIAKSAFEAGAKSKEDEIRDLREKLERVIELLSRCPNLFWYGQQVKDIESKITTKEACEKEAANLIAEINEVLLER